MKMNLPKAIEINDYTGSKWRNIVANEWLKM